MNTNWENHQNEGIKIVINAKMYKPETDNRLLIPFIDEKKGFGDSEKMGLLDKNGEVILPAEYDVILDDCYHPDDFIRVGKFVYTKSSQKMRVRYHIINASGELLLAQMYDWVCVSDDKKYIIIRDYTNYTTDGYAMFDIEGKEIVPLGKYQRLEFFDRGLARVTCKKKWGLINTDGEEVQPLIYDKIWNFANKPYDTIILVKDGVQYEASFDNPSVVTPLGHHLEGHPPIVGRI